MAELKQDFGQAAKLFLEARYAQRGPAKIRSRAFNRAADANSDL